jgi:hypothetical protein
MLINHWKSTMLWDGHGCLSSPRVSYMGATRVQMSARRSVSCFVVFPIPSKHLQSSYHFMVHNTTNWEMCLNYPRKKTSTMALKGIITVNYMQRSSCAGAESRSAVKKFSAFFWTRSFIIAVTLDCFTELYSNRRRLSRSSGPKTTGVLTS